MPLDWYTRYTALQMFFEECDYRVTEGSTLSRPLRVHYYGPVQSSFTRVLRAVSVASAESMGVGNFILSGTIAESSRATQSM